MYRIFDLHNDYFLKIKTENKKTKYVTKGTSQNIISAIWTSNLNACESFFEIEEARNFVGKHEHLFLGVEDLHFLSKNNMDKFLSLRPVYAGLTWNRSNCLAGGAHESGKLTAFGKLTIKNLEKNNIKVDTAHLNEESFLDVAKTTENPLFCSHTAVYGIQPNTRNLKDYQIKMIVDSGGLLGLCFVSDFLNGTNYSKINDVVSHIDYVACKFGIDNLALGTDFFGTSHLPKSIKCYQDITNKLSVALKKLGYTEKSINKIFFENANKFLLG